MNISVKNIFFALGATAIMASCGENSWNDHLDGFEPGVNYNLAQEASFTMSKADFKTLAENPTNIALAGADSLALKAVGKNGYFTPTIPAFDYIPAFLASDDSPYFLFPDGSKVNITYNECGETDPIIARMAGALTYTVNSTDYQNAWKSDEDFIDAFAPMTPAASKIPSILKTALANPAEGQYAVVNYAEATENPVFIEEQGTPLTVIYEESFAESTGLFTIQNVTMSENLSFIWSVDTKNKYVKASAYKNPANYDAESWLISPAITLEGTAANFSFNEATNYFADIETAKNEASVWVRIVGQEWQQITGYDFPESLGWTWVNSGDIDLSMYCGKTIQIGFKYTATAAKAGTWEVKDFVVNAQSGSVAQSAAAAPVKKVLASTPVIVNKTVVYVYDGAKWVVADGVTAVQPSDYTAMGMNPITDPAIYLPLFLKQNCPYAVSGDKIAVVYNGNACSVLAFDGQNWSVNNNEMVAQIAQFMKEDGKWRFEKYMNTIYFTLCTEIQLDTKYLIVAGDICAGLMDASKTYGYLPKANVDIVDDVIEQTNDNNAYTLATAATVDGNDYELPDGNFFIIDSTGRYLYMTGTFNSFNLSKTPAVKDGAIDDAYVFSAKVNDDGTWTITNKDKDKWMQYSMKYGSWGCYASEQPEASLPTLYILTEE